ncbi:hypothetical protein DCAR_0205417 [Daucus carota subsp. sativus]|uniref:Uncharacterized protein n=1 Tax=Daucus carota subsp. sativus TaxID=79200 RepID=A0A161Y469_DAUCS|nr:hypothetical protein DCAR_0205417 [Daucus carota subsp. sativus]
MMSSLQNLDLGCASSSKYSCFSPRPLCFDQSNAVHEALHGYVPWLPQPSSFVDTNTFSDQGQMRTDLGGYPMMYNEANQVPVTSVQSNTVPADGPSYTGGSTMNQNGGSGQAFTQPRNDSQNGNHTQGFTETNNVQNGANLPNPQGIASMAMRNEGWMVLQNAVVVELVQCMRVMNDILRRVSLQVEANEAVPRHDQQTPNRIRSSFQDLPVPTSTKTIFVGGLSSTVTENDLMDYFYQFGTITNVKVMYDHFTQRPRGFGFITFDSEEAVDEVLHWTSFHELNGKMAKVKRAIPKDIYQNSIRGRLGALNYGLSTVSNLLRACTQGYNPGQVGGSAAVSGSGYPWIP